MRSALLMVWLVVLTTAATLFGAPYAAAQTATDLQRVLETQQRIERDEAARQRRQRQDRARQRRTLRQSAAPARSSLQALAADTNKCFNIRKVDFVGSKALAKKSLDTVRRKYEGKCLNFEAVNEIVRAITNLYIDRGYITSRAYLTPQDLGSGRLEITVIEGKLSKYRYFFNETEQQRADNAFPKHGKEEPLNLRKIEQGLDNINRVPKHRAKMNIQPGKQDGESDVIVEVARQKLPIQASATTHNRGSETTGIYQQNYSVSYGDLFKRFDTTRLSLSHDLHPGEVDESSRAATWGFGVPHGNLFADLSLSYSDYSTIVNGRAQDFVSSGRTKSVAFDLDYLVHRDQISKTTLGAGFDWREGENFINGTLIEVSSRKISSASISATHSTIVLAGALNATARYEFGLPVFDALDDPWFLRVNDPHAQYHSLALDLGYRKNFQGTPLTWDATFSGQWGLTGLYGTEKFSAGGYYTVRGFRQTSIAGDSGYYFRNELQYQLPAIKRESLARVIGGVTAFVGIDVGGVTDRDANRLDHVAGVATGLRFGGSNLFGSISYERSILRPYFLDDEKDIVSIELGLSW